MSGQWLEALTNIPFVWYYRCDDCAHVWTISKAWPNVMQHVTPCNGPAASDQSG